MIALNKTINWKPASTGTGRFGNWLENLNDWNLSRSRFWGIPIPIWRSKDGKEARCIGSAEELKAACDEAVAKGLMDSHPLQDFSPGDMSESNYQSFDLHKHVVDTIVLAGKDGQPLYREADLIDVWFDSGAMPYAQWHYPFENKERIDQGSAFPADFIAEGVDQTRGWFFTLHAIATMCFDSVAYKNVVSNGLVLDKNGQKMSKRLGNAVDPFKTLSAYGPDATRWYMITNAQPWDNLRFDEAGIQEVQRKFFGTLYNTYAFFALYANVDGFSFSENELPLSERPEIDRWILSRLSSLNAEVDAAYAQYEPTRAGRLLQEFVTEELSNWYVRLCRRRFWKGDYGKDKLSAYQTLYRCLEEVAIMAAPIAPFFMDRLYRDLNGVSGRNKAKSVHLAHFPERDAAAVDTDLEQKMHIAHHITSMVLSLRKQEKVKVRQPLQRMMVPILDDTFARQLKDVEPIILSELNVKELVYLRDSEGVFVKEVKPDFKKLGPRFGKEMKAVAAAVARLGQDDIVHIEREGSITLLLDGGEEVVLEREELGITTKDIPGWLVSTDGSYTVALDVQITEALREEGLARELVNRIQNMRKDSGLELTDRIALQVEERVEITQAIKNNLEYICAETLAGSLELVAVVHSADAKSIEVDGQITTKVALQKL